jgi:hypothetical protein
MYLKFDSTGDNPAFPDLFYRRMFRGNDMLLPRSNNRRADDDGEG